MRAILLRVEWAVLAALWVICATAYAQTQAFGQELFSLDLMVWGCVLILSAVGGLASLLPKLHDPLHPVRSVALVVSSHLVGAIAAGLVTFFGAVNVGLSDMEVAASITVAGFAGTWALEKARTKLFGSEAPPLEPERRSGVDRREE